MKRLKFLMPVLAFVIAVTVAFAAPVKVETDKTQAFQTKGVKAWYEDPYTWECLECEYALFNEYECDVNYIGTICTCLAIDENGQYWEVNARNDPNDIDSSRRCRLLKRWD